MLVAMDNGLVLGGTGMLSGAVEGLTTHGKNLVVPSRREYASPDSRVRWVRAEWKEAGQLAEAVAPWAPFDLLVAWVHTPHREPVLRAVDPLLARGAPVVEIWGSAARDPLATLGAPVLARPTHQVVLGYRQERGTARWLADREISAGVLDAALAALSGAEPRVHEVGVLRPWPPAG